MDHSTHSSLMGLDDPFSSAGGGTAALSNTICISDPKEEWATVAPETVRQLSVYGEIARMDTSLMSILKCVLVTYFDVRCTQKALLELAGHSEAFPQADHDFRIVLVSTAAYAAKVGLVGGFNQFGEVANISMHHGDAIVEYYDMRSAQRLCAVAGGCASPCMPRQQAWAAQGSLSQAASLLTGGFGASSEPSQLATLQHMMAGFRPSLASLTEDQSMTRLAKAALAAEEGNLVKQERAGSGSDKASKPIPAAAATAAAAVGNGMPGSNRPVRTKISNKDFSKYDINPDKIARGEDPRTTVMVRNLVGLKARKDFLKFLEKCGLQDRYTFFYMPCKEHRDVRAGFAFVNLRSAEDVRKLYGVVKSDLWQEMRRGDPQCKPLAMSYARFQGHDELVAHFSSSVVIHETDPEKRPIFCPDNGGSNGFGGSRAAPHNAPQQGDAAPLSLSLEISGAPGLTAAAAAPARPGLKLINTGEPATVAAVGYGSGSGFTPANSSSAAGGDVELQAALSRGVQEIAAILSRERQNGTIKDTSLPAFIPAPSQRLARNAGADSPSGSMHPASIGG